MKTALLTHGVADLLRRPGSWRDTDFDVVLDDLVVLGAHVPAGAPVHLDLRLEAVNEGVVAKGSATAHWQGECRRCLGPVEGTLRAEVLEVFEVHAVDGETRPLVGDHIDLDPVAREALMLELPLAPVCADDCAGLCDTCGVDRNTTSCDCAHDEVDPRWAALDGLRLEAGSPD